MMLFYIFRLLSLIFINLFIFIFQLLVQINEQDVLKLEIAINIQSYGIRE